MNPNRAINRLRQIIQTKYPNKDIVGNVRNITRSMESLDTTKDLV